MNFKKTKIVCTIGPATESEEKLTELLKLGMNVMRLNFSHGDFEEHGRRVVNLRAAAKKTGIPAAILQDLGGPKIRIGTFKSESIVLKVGRPFTLTTDSIIGDETRVHVNYPLLPKEVSLGGTILLEDGKRRLKVVSIKGSDVVCEVIVGGEIRGKRGVNLPGANLTISSITEKDRADLPFALEHDVDFVALSFVRRPEDIAELRTLLDQLKLKAGIIAKIETAQALEHIEKIIELADGIMVARGDLAIEIPAEDVPIVQKKIIKKANEAGKPVITATQMLESMIHAPLPTRAEVSDIANAILDGTDAVMLSEETTLGEFPLQAVEVMSKVAGRVETDSVHREPFVQNGDTLNPCGVGQSVTTSAVRTAICVGARYIISLTNSGYSARMISRHKPTQPILVFTQNEKTYSRSLLSYGTSPVLVKRFKTYNEAEKVIRTHLLKHKLAEKGDRVVVATGMPFSKSPETNMIVVETL